MLRPRVIPASRLTAQKARIAMMAGSGSSVFGVFDDAEARGLLCNVVAVPELCSFILPAVHPRMGAPWTDATEAPVLEPPGFMLVNYGRATVVVTGRSVDVLMRTAQVATVSMMGSQFSAGPKGEAPPFAAACAAAAKASGVQVITNLRAVRLL